MENNSKYSDTRIGKVLEQKANDDEPVLTVVADKDKEVKGFADNRLRSLIERIERLEEEKKDLSGDIRDIFAEAKSAGFDVKAMRAVLKLRRMDAAERDEQEYLVDTYMKALL